MNGPEGQAESTIVTMALLTAIDMTGSGLEVEAHQRIQGSREIDRRGPARDAGCTVNPMSGGLV